MALSRLFPSICTVALLAEGVDRNYLESLEKRGFIVALLAEGVDRNVDGGLYPVNVAGRPPRGGRG